MGCEMCLDLISIHCIGHNLPREAPVIMIDLDIFASRHDSFSMPFLPLIRLIGLPAPSIPRQEEPAFTIPITLTRSHSCMNIFFSWLKIFNGARGAAARR